MRVGRDHVLFWTGGSKNKDKATDKPTKTDCRVTWHAIDMVLIGWSVRFNPLLGETDGAWPHLWSSLYNSTSCSEESRVNINVCHPVEPAEYDHFPNRIISYINDEYSTISSSRVIKSM